ncbi:MAG: PaaI family thioesterase [bacterium]|nr:MAG: PaaI family thioesterase [bacterium]
MEQIGFEGCFGCGQDNVHGLKATFRDMEDGGVEGVFVAQHHHCGYRDAVHVGPLVGFISEAMGRLAYRKDMYYLTQSLEVSFLCAVSPGVRIRAFATVRKNLGHHFTAEAKLFGPAGELIARAEGRFVTMKRAEVSKCVGGQTG